jgi:hypothetical protein
LLLLTILLEVLQGADQKQEEAQIQLEEKQG